MAISIGNSANANNGAGAGSLTINIPTSTNDQELLVAQIAVSGNGATPVVTGPSGSWTLLRQTDNGTSVQLTTWYLLRTTTSEPANYTWTFDAAYEAAGGITCYRNAHNDPLRIANVENGQTTASATTHATPSVTSTHTDCVIICGFAVLANATWTPPSGMTERFDTRSTGAAIVAVEGTTQAANAIQTTSKTATSSVAGVGCAHILFILPSGIARTTPATSFSVIDDTLSNNQTYFTFTEISAAYPAQFVDKSLGRRTYQGINTVAYGGTTAGNSTPTTTIRDSGCSVVFDSGRSLATSVTLPANSSIILGTKVTRSDGKASGKNGVTIFQGANATLRGVVKMYGCTYITGGAATNGLAILPASNSTGELYACLVDAAGASTIGQSTATLGTVYNVDVMNSANTGALVNIFVDSLELVTVSDEATIAGNGTITSSAVGLTMKDVKFFGDPVDSDFRWSGATATNWKLVRPEYSGNSPKFSTSASDHPNLSEATQEMWLFDIKLVNAAGVGVGGVPVKLTDSTGVVQVNTTSLSDGNIDFGTGLTNNAVTVIDHYISSGTTYATRSRSPFLAEINTGAGANSSYPAVRYFFDWPTDLSGNFRDVADVVPLIYAAGLATTWHERDIGDPP